MEIFTIEDFPRPEIFGASFLIQLIVSPKTRDEIRAYTDINFVVGFRMEHIDSEKFIHSHKIKKPDLLI